MVNTAFRALVASAALLFAAAPAAKAEDGAGWEIGATLDGIMAEVRTMMRTNGSTLFAGPFTDGLGEGKDTSFTFYARGGETYAVVGVCDEDCSDFDLSALDMAGRELASDTAVDDVPILKFTMPADGNVIVTATMAACSAEPCFFRAEVYRETK